MALVLFADGTFGRDLRLLKAKLASASAEASAPEEATRNFSRTAMTEAMAEPIAESSSQPMEEGAPPATVSATLSEMPPSQPGPSSETPKDDKAAETPATKYEPPEATAQLGGDSVMSEEGPEDEASDMPAMPALGGLSSTLGADVVPSPSAVPIQPAVFGLTPPPPGMTPGSLGTLTPGLTPGRATPPNSSLKLNSDVWTEEKERTIRTILTRHSWIERRGNGVNTRLFCTTCIAANVGGRWATVGSQRVRTSVGNEHTQAAVHERAVQILAQRQQPPSVPLPPAENTVQTVLARQAEAHAPDTQPILPLVSSLPRPLWLDCDPGHDDVMAMILAGYNPAVRLLGISTVAGNQTVEKTTDNALRVCQVAGLQDMRVVAGQARPLVRPGKVCAEIHGLSGLDGPTIPPAKRQRMDGKAVNVMFEAIVRAYREWCGGRVALVCTGALTNAAMLLRMYPEVCSMIEIVLMGGSMGPGNTGPVSEFNIQTDPEAAHVVLQSGAVVAPGLPFPPDRLPVTMVPLEVTHTALVTPEVLGRIRSATSTPFRNLLGDLLIYFRDTYRK
ncbi:hypothetical protein CYMTET_9340, partial [Cymbomonas tetramitiformis]